ncbi:MAG: pilus assembly protein TadG-related protein [Candidatus Dormiibacterota bacterium]
MLTAARRRRSEGGQILLMFALSMAFLIFGLIAVAADLSKLYQEHVRFYDAAEQAAIAGASDVVATCPPRAATCTNQAEEGLPPVIDMSTFQSVCGAVGDAVSGGGTSTLCRSQSVCAPAPSGYAGQPSCTTAAGAPGIDLQEAEATVHGVVQLPIPMPGMGASFQVSASYAAAPVLGAQQPAA